MCRLGLISRRPRHGPDTITQHSFRRRYIVSVAHVSAPPFRRQPIVAQQTKLDLLAARYWIADVATSHAQGSLHQCGLLLITGVHSAVQMQADPAGQGDHEGGVSVESPVHYSDDSLSNPNWTITR